MGKDSTCERSKSWKEDNEMISHIYVTNKQTAKLMILLIGTGAIKRMYPIEGAINALRRFIIDVDEKSHRYTVVV
jgi:hypothetical protein